MKSCSNPSLFQDKPPVVDFKALDVAYFLFVVFKNPIVGTATAKAAAEYVNAFNAKFIEGVG